MSTVNITPTDDIRTEYARPATTSPTTVLTAPDQLSITVLAVQLVNAGAAPIKVRLERYDGVNPYYLTYDTSLPVGGGEYIDFPFTIGRTETVRVTTDTANDLYVAATYFEQPTVFAG